ncbi:MAG: DUF2497 domain-containing protein [Alphaproteobacteria bacterium]|nr:DUF2497 domain-containing protein [Alphaproteobacteria bacterium]
MAENPPNQEPSMEEILASIRRIISEDGATVEPTPADPNAEPPPVVEMEEAPVLELIEEVKDDGSVENLAPQPEPEPEPAPAPVYAPPPEPVQVDRSRLISETAAQASVNALSGLSRLVGGTVNINTQPIGSGHKTLENMVADLLRPILKDWLDNNLPAIVERVVQKEIQKITRDLN